jgi:superfamily II DNA or RNA helicase
MRQQQINSLLTNDGFSTTYQSNSKGYGAINKLCELRKVLVILDEVHWARSTEGKHRQAFGAALKDAFGNAAQILSLSGTPWRSDRAAIPFVRYNAETRLVIPTDTYTYERAIRENVCRPIIFHRTDGVIEFEDSDYGFMRGYLGVETEAVRSDENEYFCIQNHIGRKYLRAATDPNINLCIKLITAANLKLNDIREQSPTAGGLIICRGIPEANLIAEQMSDELDVEPVIVTSQNGGARADIEAFARSSAPWILAVGMVTEGTDIPRLRVGVHLHTTMTVLHFRQFCGRMVRWEDINDDRQAAHIFIPQYGPLHLMAKDVESEIEMCLANDPEAKSERGPCNVCGASPCACPCDACGKKPCECADDDNYFRAICSEEEESVGSTTRGDDYTEIEQRTADAYGKNEKLSGKYSSVQLLAISKLMNDRDMLREAFEDLSDDEFDLVWEKTHAKAYNG